jgi:hypothetical protein
MAKQSRWSVAARNAMLDGVRAEFDNGYLRYYDGAQPASVDIEVSTQRLLAELRFGQRAFRAASNGTIVANPLMQDDDAKATGTPTWYRCFKADGVTALHDGSAGAADANCILVADTIVAHAIVECSTFIIVEAAAL